MVYTCRTCNRTFQSELDLELHRDTCSEGQLFCQKCGERFADRTATEDGWYYRCPNEDCDGEGIGQDLRVVDDVLLVER